MIVIDSCCSYKFLGEYMLIGYLRPLGDVEGRYVRALGFRPCAEILHTLAPKYLYRDYFKANVYTTCVHGRLG